MRRRETGNGLKIPRSFSLCLNRLFEIRFDVCNLSGAQVLLYGRCSVDDICLTSNKLYKTKKRKEGKRKGKRKEKKRKGKERKGKERKGKERKGKERKGKERKGKERKGKEKVKQIMKQ